MSSLKNTKPQALLVENEKQSTSKGKRRKIKGQRKEERW